VVSKSQPGLIVPDWPAPPRVHALQTTRQGGVSLPPFNDFNLGDHVGDDALAVARNRALLQAFVPAEPLWLKQVHGAEVVDAANAACLPQADASVASRAGMVCAVMTADCLPVLLCDAAGTKVAAVHAGWRGLAAGVIEATVHSMGVPAATLMAWLGPAIGSQAFEVGEEVREIFLRHDATATTAFTPSPLMGEGRGAGEKFHADIYLLAQLRLQQLGVQQVYGGNFCTYTDRERFFSYRRDGQTGRMATIIWKY